MLSKHYSKRNAVATIMIHRSVCLVVFEHMQAFLPVDVEILHLQHKNKCITTSLIY